MQFPQCLPRIDDSFAGTTLTTIQNRSACRNTTLKNEIMLRMLVGELALRTIADVVLHLATAAIKTIKGIAELPLYTLNKNYKPRTTLIAASRHTWRSLRSAIALITLASALAQPKLACSTYRWIGLDCADKSWRWAGLRQTLLTGTVGLAAILVYRFMRSHSFRSQSPPEIAPATDSLNPPSPLPRDIGLHNPLSYALPLLTVVGMVWSEKTFWDEAPEMDDRTNT